MKIHEALKAIDNRINFEKGKPVLDLKFFDDYDTEHKMGVYLDKTFLDRLTSRGTKAYDAKAKQFGDMIIIAIEKDMYNESYTIINNKVVDHETYNPSHFIEFRHYAMLKQDYFRKI